jgi:tetratricopeptide (TPR) repeat protein
VPALLLACLASGLAAQESGKASPKGRLSAKELYEEGKFRESQYDLVEALTLYQRVIAEYPGSEWAKLAEERRQAVVDQIEMQEFAAAPGRPLGLAGILLSLLGSCFSLVFLLSWVLFFAYRGGWLWNSTIGARIGDPISGFVASFRSRKRLGQELQLRKANPRDAKARCNLGVIHYQSRRYPQALAELSESVAIDPDRVDAQYHLGCTLLQLNRAAEAVEPLERVVASKPRHGGDALIRLAEAQLGAGNAPEAERRAYAAVNDSPSDAEARFVLALALDAQGKREHVPQLLQDAIQCGRAYHGLRRREALTAARKAQAYLQSRKV